MLTRRSVCPYDCPDACGLLIHTEDNCAVKVEGDQEHPFTRGTLCPKMAHYERTVHSSGRILTPMERTGPKGSGQFSPISWEKAVSVISDRWKAIIRKYGAEAILPFSYAGTMGVVQRNAGHPFFYSLGASRLERTICAPAKEYGWKSVMGTTMSPHPGEIQKSDLIILWGVHALATNIHILHDVNQAKKQGAAVWLIDTYKTPTAKIADRTILVRPGTDGALALGMMHVLVNENAVDKAFIQEHVQGFDIFRTTVLPHYTPEIVSEITGVDCNTIIDMARQYARARAPFIRLGSGLSRYGNGAMTVRTITCLPAMVGAWSKPGGGILTSIATGSSLDSSKVTREDFQSSVTRIINMNQLGQALTTIDDPRIMSLYVYISNPAAVVPDQNSVLKGLSRDDLFTVVHERFMTDTARYADVILPATTSLEHSDMYRSYGHYCVQRAYPAIAPVGEAKSNWDVFCLLAKAMGIHHEFFNQSADDLIDEILDTPSDWLAKTDLNKLREGLAVELPLPDNYKMNFKTSSGKIEILNTFEDEPLPRYMPPHGDNAEYWLINSPDARLLNSSFNERAELTKNNKMVLQMNPADANTHGFAEGQQVIAYNERGEVHFWLKKSEEVPAGVVVTEGVWWIEHAPGQRSVNALTAQRLTDKAQGSTLYDVKVNVRPA